MYNIENQDIVSKWFSPVWLTVHNGGCGLSQRLKSWHEHHYYFFFFYQKVQTPQGEMTREKTHSNVAGCNCDPKVLRSKKKSETGSPG